MPNSEETELKKYNFGCGVNKIKGYVNIDCDADAKPDLVIDFTKPPFPIPTNSGKQILLIHTIEHIEKWFHFNILLEMQRVLHPTGVVYIAFPEFERCAMNWINNYHGKRDFWEATLYGRGLSKYDKHVCAMRSIEMQELMIEAGFKNIKITPEPKNDYNTLISANKGERLITYEELINKEVLGVNVPPELFDLTEAALKDDDTRRS